MKSVKLVKYISKLAGFALATIEDKTAFYFPECTNSDVLFGEAQGQSAIMNWFWNIIGLYKM